MGRLCKERALVETSACPPSFSFETCVKLRRGLEFLAEAETVLKRRCPRGPGDHLPDAPAITDQTSSREHYALFVHGPLLLSQQRRRWLRVFGRISR
ncbi:hypothetical protein CVS37_07975 [Burkholderia lata]|nr:hypothetical protein CVS37_07975 [Burkholderia lata]